MKIIISGVKSGLGRFLHKNIDSLGISRDTSKEDWKSYREEFMDVIIHCAFNSKKPNSQDELYTYINDNILLTKKLLNIPHKKFIFISSVDVYPKNEKLHKEDEIINPDSNLGMYALTKLMSESLVKTLSHNYLIIRCSAILGIYSRKNSLIRILDEDNLSLTLSADSEFNYILYTDVLKFIKKSIDEDLKGIYNFTSSGNVALSEVSTLLKKNIVFGNYIYKSGIVDNSKLRMIFPEAGKLSTEVIIEFINQRKK